MTLYRGRTSQFDLPDASITKVTRASAGSSKHCSKTIPVSVTQEAVMMTRLLFAYALPGVAPFSRLTATGTA
jgi:hypothetical protein